MYYLSDAVQTVRSHGMTIVTTRAVSDKTQE